METFIKLSINLVGLKGIITEKNDAAKKVESKGSKHIDFSFGNLKYGFISIFFQIYRKPKIRLPYFFIAFLLVLRDCIRKVEHTL